MMITVRYLAWVSPLNNKDHNNRYLIIVLCILKMHRTVPNVRTFIVISTTVIITMIMIGCEMWMGAQAPEVHNCVSLQ